MPHRHLPHRCGHANSWLTHGLDPNLKSARAANYIKTLRRDLVNVAEACGVEHPRTHLTESVEILDGRTASTPLRDVYRYAPGWGLPSTTDQAAVIAYMTATETQGGTAPPSHAAADHTG